jgi:hypothetical protein
MAITDAERHRLHTKLDQVLGEEDAAVLISHLPPSGWSDVARTRDLEHLADRTEERFATMEARFDAALERGLREQNNRFLLAMGAMLTVATTAQAILTQTLGG